LYEFPDAFLEKNVCEEYQGEGWGFDPEVLSHPNPFVILFFTILVFQWGFQIQF